MNNNIDKLLQYLENDSSEYGKLLKTHKGRITDINNMVEVYKKEFSLEKQQDIVDGILDNFLHEMSLQEKFSQACEQYEITLSLELQGQFMNFMTNRVAFYLKIFNTNLRNSPLHKPMRFDTSFFRHGSQKHIKEFFINLERVEKQQNTEQKENKGGL